jgi:glycyl-tRNA synthetase alpha chain
VTTIRIAEPLLRWFEGRGCERLPAPDLAVTHGVLAPSVFFSLLGREAFRSVHLQPVRRPLDARPRLHPQRLAVHHQVYAILGDRDASTWEVALGALAALGLEPREHDVGLRAREADLPLAGVAASGWSLLVDGIEVGRMAWLVTVGSQVLAAPVLEVALGLERMAVVRRDVSGTGDSAAVARRLHAWEEEELSSHGLASADVTRLAARFESLVVEAEASLELGLALTALRLLLDAAQVLGTLHQRDHAARRGDERERRVAAGIARCAEIGAGRYAFEPSPREVG